MSASASAFLRALRSEAHALLRIGAFAFVLLLAARLTATRLADPQWILLAAGVFGDLLAAAALAGAAVMLNAASRAAARALLIIFALLTAANLEHIYALDDVLRPAVAEHAFDWHFAAGTIANLLTWPFLVIAVAVAAAYPRLRPAANRAAAFAAGAIALAASIPLAVANTASAYSWREGNAIALAAAKLLPARAAGAGEAGGGGLLRDLDGKLAYAQRPAGKLPNVLLLVLEGIPGIYLEQVQQEAGFATAINMPQLSAFAAEGLIVPNFIAHEAGTIFGTYSLHCGDYGKGSSAKLSTLEVLAPSERPLCLPGALASVGYRTEYLQAADLAFMKKDRMMPMLGFQHLSGIGAAGSQGSSFWGAEDGKLYELALERIREMSAQGQPWMMTVLNVGTHHPFSSPKEYLDRYPSPKAAAVAYLDDILAPFFAALEEEGVLEHTAVVVSSDESHGVPGHPLSGNWGVLAVRAPGVARAVQPGLFGQVDVLISMLDYLGLADLAPDAPGRSFFRAYPPERERLLLFSEGASRGERHFFSCTGQTCQVFEATGSGLMAAAYRRSEVAGAEAEDLLQLRNDALARSFNLRNSSSRPLVSIFGEIWDEPGQSIERRFDPAPNSILVMGIEVFNRGAEPVHLRFSLLQPDGRPLGSKQPQLALGTLAPGMGARANLGFRAEAPAGAVLALASSAGSAELDLEIRRLILTESAGGRESGQFGSWINEAKLFFEKVPADVFQLPSGRNLFTDVVGSLTDEYASGEATMREHLPAIGPAARYEFGADASLAAGGFWGHHLYLHSGWQMPSAGGVAMAGEAASLLLYLDAVDPDADHRLVLQPLPGTSLGGMRVFVGSEYAGELSAAPGEPATLTLPDAALRAHAANLMQLSAETGDSSGRGIAAFRIEQLAQSAP